MSALAVVLRPGDAPVVQAIDASYEGLRALVGGLLEPVHLGAEVTAWVHEEGLLAGALWNVVLPGPTPIAGTMVVVAEDAQGETVGLTPARAGQVLAFLATLDRLPLEPSSLDDFERLTGRPAIEVVFGGAP